eukprot:scaffold11847_cov79-Skeletonema_marinoi.AAC.1
MGRIPRHEHKNAAKGRKEVTIQIDSSVRLHDDSKRWNFRRGEEDNEDEESDEESMKVVLQLQLWPIVNSGAPTSTPRRRRRM